jgi:hypothetical protein
MLVEGTSIGADEMHGVTDMVTQERISKALLQQSMICNDMSIAGSNLDESCVVVPESDVSKKMRGSKAVLLP